MAYWLTSFAGTNLPTNLGDRGSMDVAAGVADAPLISLPGGRVFDPLGSTTAYRPSATFTARVMIVSDTPATIKSVLDSWQAKIGTVGTLTRTADSGGSTHTLSARLMSATVLGRTVEGSRIVRMMLTFQAVSFPWAGTAYSSVALTKATVSTTSYNTSLTVAGNTTQRIATITATPAAGTTMSRFDVQAIVSVIAPFDTTRYFTYTGSVGPTIPLVIDTGKRTVVNGVIADYAHATPPTTMEAWIEIPSGTALLSYKATFTGGTGVDVSITYADAWA